MQREDDHSVRSHAKVDWVGFVKIARRGDGDRLQGVPIAVGARNELPPSDTGGAGRQKADTLAVWKDRSAGDDLRLTELAMTDQDATYGDIEAQWELFFNGSTQREVLDAGRNPVAPGVQGMQDPFCAVFYAMYTDHEWVPEHMFTDSTALKDMSPCLLSQLPQGTDPCDIRHATVPPSWECLRLAFKDLMSRLGSLHNVCENYSGDGPATDDKIWAHARGDSGVYYAYLRTKNCDDFNKFITELPSHVGDESGFGKQGGSDHGPPGRSRSAKVVELMRDGDARAADVQQAKYHIAAASHNMQLAIKEARANYASEDDPELKPMLKDILK